MIVVAGIVIFLATYGAYFYFKERDCKVSLYTSACYRTYPQFLQLIRQLDFKDF